MFDFHQETLEIDSKEILINELNHLISEGNYVFRGYSIRDEVLPSIVRKKESDLEIELLYMFEKYGIQHINANNPIDFMSYAQHFGLPTRLLDFTYNPFIALYFALFRQKPNNAANADDNQFYYIRFCKLEDHIFFKYLPIVQTPSDISDGNFSLTKSYIKALLSMQSALNNDEIMREYLQNAYRDKNPYEMEKSSGLLSYFIDTEKTKFKNERLLFIDANQSNQRLVMQQGLFLFPYTIDESRLRKQIEVNTHLIKVHKKLRNPMQKYLHTMGINAFRLMPDLSSICTAVERIVKEERQNKNAMFLNRSEFNGLSEAINE